MLNSEKLWKCVLSHFSSNQKNPEKNIIWHIANNIEKSECVQCDELEGGPVIKCVVDRCKREYHVECAYQKGAFYLEENDPNAISFFCELHNKPPLFCVCQKPYDLSAEMVCCDECIEWFHIECIGVSKREVFKLEHYVCGSCTKLLSEGKSISTQEKERNVNKEKRSQLQQDANKRLRVLIEVSDVIAPMIDQLDGLTKSDHSLSVISDAYTYLSSDLFQCIPADDIDDADREMSKSGTAQELIPESMFGAEDLIRKWRLRLHQASGDFIDWKVSIKILLEKSTRDFAAHSLSSSQVSVIEPFLNAVEELRTEMSNLHLPVDVAPYATFFDIYSETWTHFHHFMQTLHSEQQNSSWNRQLDNHLKAALTRMRKLQTMASDLDAVLVQMLPHLIDNVYAARTLLRELTDWSFGVLDKMDATDFVSMDEVRSMLEIAKKFPIQIDMAVDLAAQLEAAQSAEVAIASFLSKSELDYDEYEKLTSQISGLQVRIPSMDAFNLAGLRVGFLQNYDAMMTSARVPLDAVEQLEFLCQDILRDDEPGSPVKGKKGKSCTLVTSLNSKLATYKATLQKLTAESQLYLTESTYAIEAYSSDESFDFSQILGQLQSCRVITVNEAIIIFLQAFDNLHDTIQRRLEGDLTGVSIADIDNLRIELHQYVETAPDTSTYAVYMEKRRQAITMLGALGDLVQHARRAWQELDRAIESCKEGESVSYDEYKSCVDKVKAARLEDAEIRVKYEELEVRITQFSERCGRVLPTITDPSTHFETLSELAETIKELPVTKQLREQILLRHDVCNLARKCISMTQNQHQSDGMDVDSDVNAVPSTTIFELRKLFQELQDLLHHVLKSASHVSHPIEESILTSIKPEFQFFYWQQEIAHLQVASIDKVFAEELHTLGIEIGAEVKAPDDWEALVVAIQALNALETEAAKVFETLAYAQVASNEAVRNSFSFKQRASLRNLSSGDTHSTDFDITSFALGGKAWKSSIGDSQAALHSLVSRSSELKVTKRDLIRSMEDALTITNKILDVQLQIMNIHISLVKSSDEDLIRKDLNQLQNNSAIEFRDLTALVNEFSSIAEKKSDFILVEMVSKFLLSFHTRATMWNDKAMSILPTKSTRRKKGEPKSITLKEIENLYHDPLCRAVKVPALMGVLALLQDARMLEAETLTLLNDRNAATSSSMSTSDKTNAEEEDYYSRKSLLEQIRAVNEKLVRIEMLPFDMAESSILSWFLEILTWVYNLPNLYLDYLSELHSTSMGGQNQDNKEAVGVMSLTDARKQVIQCNDLVNDRTSPDVVSWLLEKKILTEDISTGTHYYSDNVSPYLDRSQEIADQLKQWVDSAEELESRVHTGVSGGETLESLQSLLGEVNNSALFIDGALKRSLETFIQRQLKRSRDDSDSLLRAKASAPEDKKKKSKPTSVRCAYASCTSSVTNDSAYCSSECAIQHAPRLCKNMLAYRDVLCSAAPLPASVATLPHVVSLVEEDRLQYQLSPVSPIELFSDMTQEMNKRGYITASKFAESEKEKERLTLKNAKDYMSSYSSSGNSTPTGSMNTISIDDSVVERNESEPSSNNPTILENLLVKAEKFLSRSLLESGHTANSEALHRDRSKLTPAQVMLSSLPPRVTSIMARRGEAITAVSPKNPPNNQSVDMEMRKQVRFLFEDVFVAALSRQAISGALCMGSILALELEQELFNKAYVVVPPTSSGSKSEPRRELNKKDYKDNQMRLQRNLKQSHNDGLITRLARQEISIDTLLAMTPQELADASLQKERAKILSSSLQGSQIGMSVVDIMNANVREAMSGNEAWRGKDTPALSYSAPAAHRLTDIASSASTNNKTEPVKVKLDIAKMKEMQQQQLQEKGADSSRTDYGADESDQTQDSTRKLKRPLNVDAGTRMTTDRPKKRKEESSDTVEDKKGSSSHSDLHSPRETLKTKAPNVLDMLKAGVQPGQEKRVNLSPPQFRLVSVTGKMEFHVNTTTASNSPYFICIGCAADRRILGQLKDPLVITGRVRVAELDQFISQVQEKGRKMVIPFVLFSHKGQDTSSVFGKLCEDFAHNNRVGFCQMATDLQAYLIPPALKRHVSLLNDYTIPGGSYGAGRELYGILISREPGPVEFTSAPTVELDVMAPPEPLAPPPANESKPSSKPKASSVHSAPPTSSSTASGIQPPSYKGPTPTYAPAPSSTLGSASVPPPPQPPVFVPPPTFTVPRPSPAVAPVTTSIPVATATTNPIAQTVPPAAPLTKEMQDTINKVANFCASNGAQTIQILRKKDNAAQLMPFLFPGHTGHQEFLSTLQTIIQAQKK